MATIQEIKDMSVTDLNNELINLRREQFNLRMQHGAGDTPKYHRFSAVKKILHVLKPC